MLVRASAAVWALVSANLAFAGGSKVVQLNPPLGAGEYVEAYAVSPNGQSVLYSVKLAGTGRRLYGTRLDDVSPRPLISNVILRGHLGGEAFSADGDTAWLAGPAAVFRINLLTMSYSNITPQIPGGTVVELCCRTGDESHVVFLADIEGNRELYGTRADGSGPLVRISGAGEAGAEVTGTIPVGSGSDVIFTIQYSDGGANNYRASAAGGPPVLLGDDQSAASSGLERPIIIPGGEKLVYVSSILGVRDLFVASTGGGAATAFGSQTVGELYVPEAEARSISDGIRIAYRESDGVVERRLKSALLSSPSLGVTIAEPPGGRAIDPDYMIGDDGFVYYAESDRFGPAANPSLSRARLDGSSPSSVLTTLANPGALPLDPSPADGRRFMLANAADRVVFTAHDSDTSSELSLFSIARGGGTALKISRPTADLSPSGFKLAESQDKVLYIARHETDPELYELCEVSVLGRPSVVRSEPVLAIGPEWGYVPGSSRVLYVGIPSNDDAYGLYLSEPPAPASADGWSSYR